MIKTFIAGLTALSLTLAPAPAQAQGFSEDDIAKLVFGLIALGVATKALSEDDDDEDEVHRDDGPRFGTELRDRGGFVPPRGPGNNNGRFGTNNRVLPRSCMRRVETRYGTHRIFAQYCLNNEYAGVRSLPNQCRVRLLTPEGDTWRGYDPACLRERGYSARR